MKSAHVQEFFVKMQKRSTMMTIITSTRLDQFGIVSSKVMAWLDQEPTFWEAKTLTKSAQLTSTRRSELVVKERIGGLLSYQAREPVFDHVTLAPQDRIVGYLSLMQKVVDKTQPRKKNWRRSSNRTQDVAERSRSQNLSIPTTVLLLEVVGCIVLPLNGTVQLASLFRGIG